MKRRRRKKKNHADAPSTCRPCRPCRTCSLASCFSSAPRRYIHARVLCTSRGRGRTVEKVRALLRVFARRKTLHVSSGETENKKKKPLVSSSHCECVSQEASSARHQFTRHSSRPAFFDRCAAAHSCIMKYCLACDKKVSNFTLLVSENINNNILL